MIYCEECGNSRWNTYYDDAGLAHHLCPRCAQNHTWSRPRWADKQDAALAAPEPADGALHTYDPGDPEAFWAEHARAEAAESALAREREAHAAVVEAGRAVAYDSFLDEAHGEHMLALRDALADLDASAIEQHPTAEDAEIARLMEERAAFGARILLYEAALRALREGPTGLDMYMIANGDSKLLTEWMVKIIDGVLSSESNHDDAQ